MFEYDIKDEGNRILYKYISKCRVYYVGTCNIALNPNFNDIYFDGVSHYYLDGSVLKSGSVPVLMYDTDTKKYYSMTENGLCDIIPYDEEY